MTPKLFTHTIKGLRTFVDKASEVEKLTGFNWTETFVGDLFDLFYDILIPDANDAIFEDFGELLFGEHVTDLDIEDFYSEYKESLN